MEMNHTHNMEMGHTNSMDIDHDSHNVDHMNALGNQSMHDMGMHMMMFFHFTKNIQHLLFEEWSIRTDAELFGAIAFGLALAILYEGLKTLKELLTKKANRFLPHPKNEHSKINSERKAINKHSRLIKLWLLRVLLSVLRVVEVGLAYILMLLAMTYNGWLFLSVCVGAGIGFFVFLPIRRPTSSDDDHCG